MGILKPFLLAEPSLIKFSAFHIISVDGSGASLSTNSFIIYHFLFWCPESGILWSDPWALHHQTQIEAAAVNATWAANESDKRLEIVPASCDR